MLLLIPIAVDVPMSRWPWMNWAIIALTIVCFPIAEGGDSEFGAWCVAGGDHWLGHLLHPLAHIDIFHLLGNLLFLWVFGNAVCAKVGNLAFLPIYFLSGLVGSLLSSIVQPAPSIGASGAINTVVGLFLAFYAQNAIKMFLLFIVRPILFELASGWVILLWFAFDLLGAFSGGGLVDYAAHVVGFLLGLGGAVVALKAGWIVMDDDERSILDLLASRRTLRKPARRPLPAPSDRAAGAAGQRGPSAIGRPRDGAGSRPAPSDAPARPRPTPKRVDDDPIPLADEPTERKERRPT